MHSLKSLTLSVFILSLLVTPMSLANAREIQEGNTLASFADLAEELLPSVVNVSSTAKIEELEEELEEMPDMPQFPPGSPFEDFFEEFMDKRGKRGGGGLGPQLPAASSWFWFYY